MTNRIIVIEDEPLISLDIEQAVSDAGCDVAGFARTADQGLVLLDTVACDGAVLDANLNGHSAKPIIDRLKATKVPYIVVSGYSRDQLDFLDDTALLIGKPFNLSELTSTIRKHLGCDNLK